MSDPRCGACGKHLSRHFHERDGVFCNRVTNGDAFTCEPSDETVLYLFEKAYPNAREELVRQWKIDNGHEGSQ